MPIEMVLHLTFASKSLKRERKKKKHFEHLTNKPRDDPNNDRSTNVILESTDDVKTYTTP